MLSSLLFLTALTQNTSISTRMIDLNNTTHFLEEPEFVADGVERAEFSPDGTMLISLGITPRPNTFGEVGKDARAILRLWSATTRQSTGSYTAPAGYGIAEMMWEGPGNSVVLWVETPGDQPQKILRIARDGKASEIQTGLPANASVVPASSPKQGGIFLVSHQAKPEGEMHRDVLFVPPGQTTPVRVTLPEPSTFAPGIDPSFRFYLRTAPRKTAVYAFDVASMRFSAVDRSEWGYPPQMDPLVNVDRGSGAAIRREGRRATFDSWWLLATDEKVKYNTALLAPKAKDAGVSSKSLNAFYIDAGNLFVRRLMKITKDQVDDLLECEERKALMSDAKQVGTAIMIYMGDNDDIFPPGANFRDRIFPYIKNDAMLDGFVYSYRGPPEATAVADPAKTELGYKEGNFGKAIVRTDSSVIWESRRKRPAVGGC